MGYTFAKRGVRIGLVGVLLLLTSAVYAQGAEPQHSDPYWQATYWNNTWLVGAPAFQTVADRIDFDWGCWLVYSLPWQ